MIFVTGITFKFGIYNIDAPICLTHDVNTVQNLLDTGYTVVIWGIESQITTQSSELCLASQEH